MFVGVKWVKCLLVVAPIHVIAEITTGCIPCLQERSAQARLNEMNVSQSRYRTNIGKFKQQNNLSILSHSQCRPWPAL